MRADAPAWPPKARQSSTITDSPSDARVDRRGEPGRAGADDRDVVDLVRVDRPTRPMQRASSLSLGLRSSCAVRAEHDRQLRRCRRGSARQRPRAGVAVGIETLVRMAVAVEEALPAAARRRRPARPMMTGPPAPVSSSPTRRRISARMMRSPSSASATSTSRSRSDGMTSASTGLRRPRASTSDGRPESCASSPMNDPGRA